MLVFVIIYSNCTESQFKFSAKDFINRFHPECPGMDRLFFHIIFDPTSDEQEVPPDRLPRWQSEDEESEGETEKHEEEDEETESEKTKK